MYNIFRILSVVALLTVVGCSSAKNIVSNVNSKISGVPKTQGTFKVGNPYKIQGKKYYPKEDYNLVETGIASWYGPNFHGKLTANGETFNQYELTAAHRTLQMPSLVRVTNLENGRSVVVRINDRGPFSRGRIIDMSKRGAELLGFKNKGTAKVRLEVLTQESLALAESAKRGESTSGVEVAMNEISQEPSRQKTLIAPTQSTQAPTPLSSSTANNALVNPVEQVSLKGSPVQGHSVEGNFYPDPVVKTVPVVPTNIFVQAGSFANQDNAIRLAQKLSSYGHADVYPSIVNGRQFYRVRLSATDVSQADTILNVLSDAGNSNAIIVVE